MTILEQVSEIPRLAILLRLCLEVIFVKICAKDAIDNMMVIYVLTFLCKKLNAEQAVDLVSAHVRHIDCDSESIASLRFEKSLCFNIVIHPASVQVLRIEVDVVKAPPEANAETQYDDEANKAS